ncbi:hypothetical protein B4U80_10716 [Leptotrombidium deliense]|uniref:Alkaline ceramidase n=1 Tax=Leptotrombidium deliense TaxID=299467 RepID=A0A443S3K5_9ACAR|nr:hypothetical protein B4U80_10716 [Leptotrombidium deliense]
MIPAPLVPLTQGHAIWHCFAGYGSYLHIYFCAEARARLLKQKTKLEWDYIGIRIIYNDLKK